MKTSVGQGRYLSFRKLVKQLLAGVVVLSLAFVVFLVAILNWPLPDMPKPGITGDFVIKDVAIVDVVNERTLPGRDVVLRNGRIDSINASSPASASNGLTVVDGAGKYLIPGLWDMHVHSLKISPQYTHPLAIANGITGVREMWSCPGLPDSFVACSDDIERWRIGLRDRTHLAPRYIMRSSYAINGERGVPPDSPAYFKARDADEARALVAHHAGDGVDLLKTYTDVTLDAYSHLSPRHQSEGCLLQDTCPYEYHSKPYWLRGNTALSIREFSCLSAIGTRRNSVPCLTLCLRTPRPCVPDLLTSMTALAAHS